MLYSCVLHVSGDSPQGAADRALRYMAQRVNGSGGAVVVGMDGSVGVAFTTERMAWAHISNNILHSGLDPNEDVIEQLPSNNT